MTKEQELILEAFNKVLICEANALKEEFVGGDGKKYVLNIKRKSSTNEWVVRVHIDGKYNEDSSYYTDDKEDAIGTMAAMKKQFLAVKK